MRFLQHLAVVILISNLLACSDTRPPVLRVGTNIWPGYEPLYLARHNKYLDANKVHLVEFSSTSQVIQAYRNELIDAAAMTLDEALSLLAIGAKIKIVLVMDISDGGDAIIGQSDIKKFADIKGKRVGVESNALGAFVISRALEINNIDKQSIKLIQLDINEQEKAFKDHKVEAVVTFDPVRSNLLKSGGNLLFDSRKIPGEIVDIMVVRESYLKQYQQNVQHLLDSWYQALALIKEKPNESAKILGLRMKLDVKQILDIYDGMKLPTKNENIQLIQQSPPELLKTTNALKKIMLKNDLLRHEVNASLLFSENNLNYK